MYFSGHLAIDPSQESSLRRVKPSDVTGKIAYFLSGGSSGKLEELESFITVNILQQVNMALRAVSIDNFVHLLRNKRGVYRDNVGKKHDLKKIMDEFRFDTAGADPEDFQTILLVCEHEDESFKYLLDVHIARVHSPKAYPIHLRIDAIPANLFSASPAAMQPVFASQSSYDTFLETYSGHFSRFLSLLRRTFSTYIDSDDIRCGYRRCIVCPRQQGVRISKEKAVADSAIFRSYFGFDTFPQYAKRWTTAMENNHINCQSSTIVDDLGRPILASDHQGFNCGDVVMSKMTGHFQSLASGVLCRFAGHHYHFHPDDRPLKPHDKFAIPDQDLGWSLISAEAGVSSE